MQAALSSRIHSVLAFQDVPGRVVQALLDDGVLVSRVEPEQLTHMLGEDDRSLLLIWDLPLEALAADLQRGADGGEALREWLARHRELLVLFKRHRRRLKLIDGRLFSQMANAQEQYRIASLLGLPELPVPQPDNVDGGDQLIRMLAQLALPRVSSLRDCLEELEASSFTFASDTLALTWFAPAATAFQQRESEIALLYDQVGLQLAEAQHALTQQTRQSTRVIEALKAQLAAAEKARNDIEHTSQATEVEFNDRVSSLTNEMELLRDQIDIQLSEAARKEEEKLRLEDARNRVAYESERALARALADRRAEAIERKSLLDALNDLEARNATLEEERNILAQRLDEVFASRSWRITKPLRLARLKIAPISDDQGAL